MVWEDTNIGARYGVTQHQFVNGTFRGANIRLNPNLAVTANQRLKTTCHEIGHGLALSEHPGGPAGYRGSCMVQGSADGSNPVVTYPDWHDFEVVNQQNWP